jgi:MraZ protein
VFAHTEEVACDAQGRLLIPGALRAYAGIEREVTSIGSLTRVEIWAKERLAEHAAPENEVGDFMAELGLY